RRILQPGFKGALPVNVAQPRSETAYGAGQVVGQNLSQPAQKLRFRAAAKLVPVLVRREKRLLHHIRSIQLAMQPGIELQAGKKQEVLTAALQQNRFS